MSNNEFCQSVSVDFAPRNSFCEWCGKPAVQQLTAIGGKYHNKGGFFCLVCGEEFTHAVSDSLKEVMAFEQRQTDLKPSPEEKYGSDHLPLGYGAWRKSSERTDDESVVLVS